MFVFVQVVEIGLRDNNIMVEHIGSSRFTGKRVIDVTVRKLEHFEGKFYILNIVEKVKPGDYLRIKKKAVSESTLDSYIDFYNKKTR